MRTGAEQRLHAGVVAWLKARGWTMNPGSWQGGLQVLWSHRGYDVFSLPEADAFAEEVRRQRARAHEDRNTDIAAADRGADDVWRDEALATIRRVAATRAEFTTDDVLEANPALEAAREPRALGPMMLYAARDGIIAPTDRYASSTRRQSNARHKRVWRSLVFGGREPQPGRTAGMEILEAVP